MKEHCKHQSLIRLIMKSYLWVIFFKIYFLFLEHISSSFIGVHDFRVADVSLGMDFTCSILNMKTLAYFDIDSSLDLSSCGLGWLFYIKSDLHTSAIFHHLSSLWRIIPNWIWFRDNENSLWIGGGDLLSKFIFNARLYWS